jgi:hypothetical protein
MSNTHSYHAQNKKAPKFITSKYYEYPMLRLNGDLFWEEKFHAANGKTQAMHSRCLAFFSFEVLGGGGKDLFLVFPLVHKVFPLCSL